MPVTELFGNKLYWVRKLVAAYLFLLALNCLSYTYMESWEGHGLQLLMGRGIGKDIQEEKKRSVFDFFGKPSRRGRTTNSMHAHYMSSSTEIFSKRRKIYSL